MIEEKEQSKPDSRILSNLLGVAIRELSFLDRERGHQRAGFTKNHSQKRNKVRAKMSRNSRRLNRGK